MMSITAGIAGLSLDLLDQIRDESAARQSDFYKAVCARVLGCPEAQVSPADRQEAKMALFMYLYGMRGGLAASVRPGWLKEGISIRLVLVPTSVYTVEKIEGEKITVRNKFGFVEKLIRSDVLARFEAVLSP